MTKKTGEEIIGIGVSAGMIMALVTSLVIMYGGTSETYRKPATERPTQINDFGLGVKGQRFFIAETPKTSDGLTRVTIERVREEGKVKHRFSALVLTDQNLKVGDQVQPQQVTYWTGENWESSFLVIIDQETTMEK